MTIILNLFKNLKLILLSDLSEYGFCLKTIFFNIFTFGFISLELGDLSVFFTLIEHIVVMISLFLGVINLIIAFKTISKKKRND